MTVIPTVPQRGNYGVSHGTGIVGELIRHATESWAGHAGILVSPGVIVEAAPPATRLAPADTHPDAIWNVHENLTGAQRAAIVKRARALLGVPYDYGAYIGFALEVLHLRGAAQLADIFRSDHRRVCSADVADAYSAAGIDLTGGLKFPNLVSPADLYNRIAKQAGGK